MIIMVKSMKITKEDIDNVIALFDSEDVFYIHSDILHSSGENIEISKEKRNVKVKKIGEENDGSRK